MKFHTLLNDFLHEYVYSCILKHATLNVFALHALTKLMNFHARNLSLLLKIMFIAHDYYVLLRKVVIVVELVYPLEQIEKRLLISDIKQQDATVAPSVIGRR